MITALVAIAGVAREAAAQSSAHMKDTVPSLTDGVPIVHEARGADDMALVFVYGWKCDRFCWADQLQRFASEHRVVAVDLAGHVTSGLDRRDWTIEAFGGDVAAVVEKLGLSRVVLVGHSMNGDVIAEGARQLFGRVVGMVWVDTDRTLGAGHTPAQVEAFVATLRTHFADSTRKVVRGMMRLTSDPALVERIAVDLASAAPSVALDAVEHFFHHSRTMPGALQTLKLPVVAINPDDGPTDVASLARHGVRVVVILGVGHFAMLEGPTPFERTTAGCDCDVREMSTVIVLDILQVEARSITGGTAHAELSPASPCARSPP